MASISIIFYPEIYIGFNKTRLLERRLLAEGILGVKRKLPSGFYAGSQFWRFIPKNINVQKSPLSIPLISIHSVSVWAPSHQSTILERTNTILIEGDLPDVTGKTYDAMCRMLKCITGDSYLVMQLPEPAGDSGIANARVAYMIEGR